jgi:hypothetical protein
MRRHIFEQWRVDDFLNKVPEAEHAFRINDVDPTHKLSLANATAASGASADEVMAVMEYRLRQAANRTATSDVETKPAITASKTNGAAKEDELVAA